ncbi:MAG: argininosuccinate lyase [Acidobacteria bacterium RIFCSPLOWO2_02_FULL_61_28]|nr:MAG: argininosuccinate lyase [Acidobacteria bacterium RIFCSPLOWO2_02_FULL_61_28]
MRKSPKTPYKLWGGRFEKPPAKSLEAFSQSLSFDYRLAQADIEGTKAYARALERARILTRRETARAVRALAGLSAEITKAGAGAFAGAEEEDIHTFVLGKLRERVGELADKLHTGRSRNEQVALDFRIWLKGTIRATQENLKRLLTALVAKAEKDSSALLPGYTHLRRAQPVLWSHYLLAYLEMFRRDHERLETCFQSADVMPLGSGALAGSGFNVDRRKLANELGFACISRNSLDAVSDRDFALEFLFAATVCFLHLSRLAEDWILYSSEEFGFLELAEEVSTGSSLMPQKKNPDSLELIRGKTGRVLGHLVALATTVKGLPLTYNRDLQEDKEPVFDAAEQLGPALELAAQVVETTTLHPEEMAKAASVGWLCATDLAEFLAEKGVPFHQGHEIVGRLVRESLRAGKQPQDCTLEDLQRYSPVFDRKCLPLLSPETGIARRAVPGGTAPRAVRQALQEARAWLRSL